MTGLVFVDTNVLLYAIDSREGSKHQFASDWLGRLWRERTGRTSVQVLSEVFVNATRMLSPGLEKTKCEPERNERSSREIHERLLCGPGLTGGNRPGPGADIRRNQKSDSIRSLLQGVYQPLLSVRIGGCYRCVHCRH